jgi:alpha-tubulin suppressor-like RCC1 family protein
VANGVTGVTSIGAGHRHTCALLADHTVRCWGANEFGALGDGTRTDSTVPVAVKLGP